MTAAPPEVTTRHCAAAFGVRWMADLPLPHFDGAASQSSGTADFDVNQVVTLPERQALARLRRGLVSTDGFRFRWEQQVTFDFHAPGRIDYLPGPDWSGALPDSFYSTVAALALAWSGKLPLHASAVEWQGRAYLLAGKAGAGKSTLAAELLANGAKLISDDLTVLAPTSDGPGLSVVLGRPAMRLHPGTAQAVEAFSSVEVPDDPRGKLLVRPVARSEPSPLPLGGILLLGGLSGPLSPLQALRLLPPHQFRPRWSELIPGHGQRRAWLIALAGQNPVFGLPPVTGFDEAARRRRAEAAMAAFSR